MDILLRFKYRNHDAKFHENLELYTSRMIIAHSILCIVTIPFAPLIQYFSYNALAGVGTVIERVVLTTTVNLFLLILSLILRKHRAKLARRQNAVRWALDILYCLVEGYESYYFSQGLKIRSNFQSYFWGWWNSLNAIIKINIISRWYMKLIAYFILIVNFGVITYLQQENSAILVTFAQAVIFLGLKTYFEERSDKKRFIEKQTLFEETEALREIIEQTNEAVMVYGIDEGILFKNLNKYEWWGEELSLENNFRQVRLDNKGNPHGQATTEMSEYQERSDLFTLIEGLRTEYRRKLKRNAVSSLLNSNERPEQNVLVVYGEVKSSKSDKVYQLEIRIIHMSYREKPALALIIADITQRNLIVTLQDNNNYKNRLLASVSHELRTPLNASINFTRMAVEDPTVPANIKDEYLAPSLVSNQLLLHLINDILDFSQISANKLRLVYENLDFQDTIDQCVNLIRLQTSRKKLGLKVEYTSDCSSKDFFTDHNRLKQIVLNMLSNALKFTLEGEIIVTAHLGFKPSSFVDLVPTSMRKQLRVSVQDTGIGMSEQDQKKLFKAFEKIELGDKVALNSTGVGLGLLISNNLVIMLNQPDGHDNCIKVESEPNVGTKFSFTIIEQEDSSLALSNKSSYNENHNREMDENPYKDDDDRLGTEGNLICTKPKFFQGGSNDVESEIMQHSTLPRRSVKTGCYCPSILVVDDDIFNVTALEIILKKLGLVCDTSFNGKQAIEKIIEKAQGKKCGANCATSYRAVLMDCSMPIMDGFEASKFLRELMQKKEIPETTIVACTAFVQEREKQLAKEAGMQFHLVKPLTQEKVSAVLKKTEYYYLA